MQKFFIQKAFLKVTAKVKKIKRPNAKVKKTTKGPMHVVRVHVHVHCTVCINCTMIFFLSAILAEEDDVLVNVNVVDSEKAAKNIELRKGKPAYNPYDDEEEELGEVHCSSRSIHFRQI